MLYKIPFALLVINAIAGGAGFGFTGTVTYEQIKEQTAIRQSYTINDEVELALPLGKAVCFQVTDNAYGVKEYYVYTKSDGQFWICYLDMDGHMIDKRSTDFRRLKGSLQQVGATECLAIMKWQAAEDALQLRFCLSNDKQKNQAVRQEVVDQKIRMAMGNRNGNPYPPVPPKILSETERLAGFAHLWSEVKYNFAFFDQVPDLDWDQVLHDYLPKVQAAETEEAYYRVLLECMALLQDGHTQVWGPGTRSIRGPDRLPIELLPFGGGKAVISAICSPLRIRSEVLREQLESANLTLYEEVTHIDGRPVQQILEEEIYPWICASTAQDRDLKAFPELVGGPERSTAALRIRGLNGRSREVTLTRGSYSPGRQQKSNEFVCRELESGILYVNLPYFGSKKVVDDFAAIFPKVREAKGLILDVRQNGGGDTRNGNAIISKLTDVKIAGSIWRTRKHLPAFRAWGRKEEWHVGQHGAILPTEKDPYLGPLVVLTGPKTVSAAEDFVVALHAGGRATIVGERTAGTTGQPLRVKLPGSGGARICTKHDLYPDGREFVGVGVIPDVEVQPTLESLVTGEDLVLQIGVEVLKGKL